MSHIAVIGGASASFTVHLMSDLVRARDLFGSRIVLMDINRKGLEVVGKVARMMCKAAGAGFEIETTTDRRLALKGADFVVTTVAVGTDRAWQLDVEIPLKFGIVQTVGDTVGPGGIMRAQRVIPLLLDVAHDVEKLAPRAWIINFSNPMSANCFALANHSRVPVVGLCHGLIGTTYTLADALKVPFEECRALANGINHFTWIYDFRRRGKSLLGRLDRAVRSGVFRKPSLRGGFVSTALYETFGRYPSPGDRHVSEFLPHFLGRDGKGGWRFGLKPFDIKECLRGRRQHWQRLQALAAGRVPIEETLHGSSESAIDVMVARVTDAQKFFIAVNVRNQGCVPNLPDDAVVEVPGVVGADGVRGIQTPPLPDGVAALANLHVTVQRLSARAALAGDRQLLAQAMVTDPLVRDFKIVEPMMERMLKTFRRHLPQYWT